MLEFVNSDYMIYKNIKIMCDNRKIILDKYEDFSIIDFNNRKNAIKYFTLLGNKNSINYQILILYNGIPNQNKKDLIKNLENFSGKKILIYPPGIKIPENKDIELLESKRYFSYNWLENASIKGYKNFRVLSKEEINQLFENYFIEKKNLPLINFKTHEVVWNGFEVGDIIEDLFPSYGSSDLTNRYLLVSE